MTECDKVYEEEDFEGNIAVTIETHQNGESLSCIWSEYPVCSFGIKKGSNVYNKMMEYFVNEYKKGIESNSCVDSLYIGVDYGKGEDMTIYSRNKERSTSKELTK